MKSNIHVETPDGQVLPVSKDKEGSPGGNSQPEKQDPKDILAGPKQNPDPFANANLKDKEKAKSAEGTGTEVTDGEAG
jgi:hypothetical protein